MHRISLVVLASLISAAASAQFNDLFSSGRDRLALIFNWNYWLNNQDTTLELQAQSRGFDGHWTFDVLFKEQSRFSVGFGLGISSHNVFHKSSIRLDSNITVLTPYPDSVSFTKNKLATTYLEVPVELRWRSKPDKNDNSWKLAVGLKAGMLLSAKTKYVGQGSPFGLEIEEAKIKTYRVPNINQFRYGPTVRFGYGNFNLVAFYALSTLFEPNLGPKLNPFSVGISFNFL